MCSPTIRIPDEVIDPYRIWHPARMSERRYLGYDSGPILGSVASRSASRSSTWSSSHSA